MLATMNLIRITLEKHIYCCLLVLVCLSLPLSAQATVDDVERFNISDDYEMDRRFDWTITVKTTPTPNVLNYASATLKPMSRLYVDYRMTPRLNVENKKQPISYEEVWFHEQHAVGCRRYHILDLPAGYQGAIRVVPTPGAIANGGAVANCIARLALDVGLRKCIVTVVFVPQDIFEQVSSHLTDFGFSLGEDNSGQAVPLFLFSDPAGLKSTLYLRGK